MIYFYSGRPGSGKSLHCAKMIDQYHRKGKNVICNFEVNHNFWKHKRCKKNKFLNDYGIVQELTNEELTIDFLMDFANKNHKRNKRGQIIEKQTLLIIDECQTMPYATKIYNLPLWKYGFSTATKVRDSSHASFYITKYITKDVSRILANQHRYLASQNTERPVEKVYHIDYDILQYAMEKHLEQVDYISNVKMPFANQQITYMEFNK